MPQPITQKLIDEIRRRFEFGEKKNHIAKALNLCKATVQKYTPTTQIQLTPLQIGEVRRRVQEGESRRSVATEYGINAVTIYRHTHDIALPKKVTPAVEKEIRRRILAGESVSTIARELNLHRATLQRYSERVVREYPVSIEQKAAIQSAKDTGASIHQISKSLSIPFSVVNAALGGLINPHKHAAINKKEIVKAIVNGETVESVATRNAITADVAKQWVREAVKRGEAKPLKKQLWKSDDHTFLWVEELDPAFASWRTLLLEWIEAEKPNFSSVLGATTTFFDRYLIGQNLRLTPAQFLARRRTVPDFYKTSCPDSKGGRGHVNLIHRFIEWVLDSPDFADVEDGVPIRLTSEYRNPITPFETDSYTPRNTESTKVVLPYYLVSDLRRRIAQGAHFRDWTWVRGLAGRETLSGDNQNSEWFQVTENRIDKSDPDCVWRLRERVGEAPILEMWSPIRWVLLLTHLQTVSRGGQLRMLDTGEADTFIWEAGQFTANPNPLRQGTARKPRQQGVFRRPSPIDESQGVKVCIYFNTNKTRDIGKVGPELGFECPWPQMADITEDPYYWFERLRRFQMKYNPIDRLTKWSELKGGVKLSAMSEERLTQYPDAAFLFRTPEIAEHPNWPISKNVLAKTWQKLIAAYEDVLAKENVLHPSGEPIQLVNPDTGRAWSSPHATRVSLITHMILDGDVPPVIMMKIAGHARFIMTLYYTKAGFTSINNAIKQASERLEESKYETFERDLMSANEERMRNRVVFNAQDWTTVLSENPADRTPLGWLHMHDRVCLAGGNTHGDRQVPGCHNGGPLTRAATNTMKAEHGPVPGGVRNCTRCRWSASGKEHLMGLHATANNRIWHLHKAGEAAIAAEREYNQYMKDKARAEAVNEPFAHSRQMLDAERRRGAAMQKLQELAEDVAAVHRTIERVIALPDNAEGSMALVAQGDLVTVHSIIEDIDSELLQLAGVVADLEMYADLDAGTAIYEYAHLMDAAFEREGQTPILARLSEKEKLACANSIMRQLENTANPNNPILGRRRVVEIMDRGESLEKLLGVKLKSVIQLAAPNQKPVSLRLVKKEDLDDAQRRTS